MKQNCFKIEGELLAEEMFAIHFNENKQIEKENIKVQLLLKAINGQDGSPHFFILPFFITLGKIEADEHS